MKNKQENDLKGYFDSGQSCTVAKKIEKKVGVVIFYLV